MKLTIAIVFAAALLIATVATAQQPPQPPQSPNARGADTYPEPSASAGSVLIRWPISCFRQT